MDKAAEVWDLRSILEVLRRRRRWIVISTLLTVGLAILMTVTATPVYTSQGEILVEPEVPLTSNPEFLGRVEFTDQEMTTQLRLINSNLVAQRVIDRLALSESPDEFTKSVRAFVFPDTRVLLVMGSDPDPERAQQFVQVLSEEYLEYRRTEAIDRRVAAAASLATRVEESQAKLTALDERIAVAGESVDLLTLGQDREAIVDELAVLEPQLSELLAAERLFTGGGAIIKDADLPTKPSEPKPLQNLVIALIFGVGIGVVLAFAIDAVDDMVYTVDEVASDSGLPILGRVPFSADTAGGPLPMLRQPETPGAESFRELRANLRFTSAVGDLRTVVVTSSIESEGKTVTSVNLAVAVANAGRKVVVVDADLRRPSIGKLLNLPHKTGLSSVLVGDTTLEKAVLGLPEAGIDVLLSGPVPPNPSELLGSSGAKAILARLAANYDMVIIDSPPVLVVPDVLELVEDADATILVAELQRVTRKELRAATERLARAEAIMAGIVVNRADLDPSRTGNYYYYYYAAD